MPAGPWARAGLLQHQHRMARGELREQVVERGRQHVGQPSAAARGGNQLGLQAALAARKVDLGHELVWRDLGA